MPPFNQTEIKSEKLLLFKTDTLLNLNLPRIYIIFTRQTNRQTWLIKLQMTSELVFLFPVDDWLDAVWTSL